MISSTFSKTVPLFLSDILSYRRILSIEAEEVTQVYSWFVYKKDWTLSSCLFCIFQAHSLLQYGVKINNWFNWQPYRIVFHLYFHKSHMPLSILDKYPTMKGNLYHKWSLFFTSSCKCNQSEDVQNTDISWQQSKLSNMTKFYLLDLCIFIILSYI